MEKCECGCNYPDKWHPPKVTITRDEESAELRRELAECKEESSRLRPWIQIAIERDAQIADLQRELEEARKRYNGSEWFRLKQRAEAAEKSLAERDARVKEMREAILWAYQLAGAVGEPVEHLDNLSALGRGEAAGHEWGTAGDKHLVIESLLAELISAAEPFVKALESWNLDGCTYGDYVHVDWARTLAAAVQKAKEVGK